MKKTQRTVAAGAGRVLVTPGSYYPSCCSVIEQARAALINAAGEATVAATKIRLNNFNWIAITFKKVNDNF